MTLDATTLALACAVLLGAGYVVLGVCSVMPGLAPGARTAWPALLGETLIVGVAAGTVWAGGWVLTTALALLALRVGYEAARVVFGLPAPHSWGVGVAIAALGLGAGALPPGIAAFGALALFSVTVTWRSVRGPRDTSDWLELAIFPGVPTVYFVAAGTSGLGVWLLAAFILVETFDSYALLGGRLFGRRKAFPNLSPGKTVEGLALGGGMLLATAAGAGALLADIGVATATLAALAVGVLAVAGDLAASRLKRRASVKDYPEVLPHQGGLLDIADAWIAAGAGLAAATAVFGAL